jgi:ABC-type transport system substrate-binding protein
MPRVRADPRYRPLLLRHATLRTDYLALNCTVPPFDRVLVRQAMNFAIDKTRLVEFLDGQAVPANTILPPEMPGAAAVPGYAHDPVMARRRLKRRAGGGSRDDALDVSGGRADASRSRSSVISTRSASRSP